MPLELWIPPSAKRKVWRCLCGKTYPEAQEREFLRHIERCSGQDERIEEELEPAPDLISGPISDQEAWKWGRKRMAEGRVGFKRGRPA